ncbi:hypothetical protein [uncultured Ottowia sp.]|uniref:hypothetical protein n=1 Tax=uncultured Ottowia sp. TaxID=543067 RepID=UPI0025957ECC|nr:hypothetical protein [uncultured Ottowia sp.]
MIFVKLKDGRAFQADAIEPFPNRSRTAIEAPPRRAFDRRVFSVRNGCGPRGLACLKRNGAWKNDSVKSRRKKT